MTPDDDAGFPDETASDFILTIGVTLLDTTPPPFIHDTGSGGYLAESPEL